MLDPNIITRGAEMAQRQQQQNMEALGELGGNFGRLVLGRRINQMQQLKPEQRQEFANNSIFAPFLNTQLRADQAAALKSKMEQEKHAADVGNTNAQAEERMANAGDITQKTTINRQRAMSGALAAALSGDPKAVSFMLEQGRAGGVIDGDSYARANRFLLDNEKNPEAIASLVKSLGIAGAEKPEQYIQPDANTVANNETTRATNEATVGATLAGQQMQKEIAEGRLNLDRIIQQQKVAHENGEFETMQGSDGITYAVYKSGPNAGQVEPLRIKGGDVFKQQAKNKLDSGALKQVNEYNSQLVQAKASQVKIGGLLKDLKSGNLNLSPQAILAAEARARLGQSTPSDLAIGRFNTALNQAVNDVLMAAKGTQTEGDAQRAAQVIAANPPRDNAAALQALQNLALVAKTNIKALDNNLNTIYANFGMERPQMQISTPKPQQPSPSPKGSIMSFSDVKETAQRLGISADQAAEQLKKQGVVIK